jgi:hypothetical protein
MTRTSIASIELDGRLIVVRVDAGVRQTLANARENLAACVAATGGVRRALLVDISRAEPLEAEVRHVYVGELLATTFSAIAMLVAANPLGRMMGNIYLRAARLQIPSRLFADEQSAVRWLLEQTS